MQKKLREIKGLEEKQKAGEELAPNQVREPAERFSGTEKNARAAKQARTKQAKAP